MTKQQSRAGTCRWKAVPPIAASILGSVLVLVACSNSSTSPSGTASPTGSAGPVVTPGSPSMSPKPSSPSTSAPTVSAAACQHVKSLRGSLTSLTHTSFTAGSATVITADVKNIKTQLDALKGEPALSSAVSQLSPSVNQVQSAANAMTSPPTASQVHAVIKALSGLKATATPVISQLKAACP